MDIKKELEEITAKARAPLEMQLKVQTELVSVMRETVMALQKIADARQELIVEQAAHLATMRKLADTSAELAATLQHRLTLVGG